MFAHLHAGVKIFLHDYVIKMARVSHLEPAVAQHYPPPQLYTDTAELQ